MIKKWITISVACCVCACGIMPIGFTSLGEIINNPSKYEGSEVKIKGAITDVIKLPLISSKMYMVKDDTGEMLVVTNGAAPGIGEQIAIKAKVENLAIIGKESIGVHLIEVERL